MSLLGSPMGAAGRCNKALSLVSPRRVLSQVRIVRAPDRAQSYASAVRSVASSSRLRMLCQSLVRPARAAAVTVHAAKYARSCDPTVCASGC